MQPHRIMEVARKKGIDKLFITDHNHLDMAKKMQKMFPRQVMVGEEIITTQGELLAFFSSTNVPAGLEPMEAIIRLRNQGAFISVSHPYDRMRKGWAEKDLLAILPYVDALEVFNSRCLRQQMNELALGLCKRNNLLSTVGSDAHTYGEIGSTLVRLPDFNDAKGLRKSLQSARFDTHLSPFWVHFGSHWAAWVKKAGCGSKTTLMVDE